MRHLVPDGCQRQVGIGDFPNRFLEGTDAGALPVDDIFHRLVLGAAMPFSSSTRAAAPLMTKEWIAFTPSRH